ncbi:MAG: HAD family phosphatase [Elusimicrobia bacterium]|nr:HAD family phosphatase [Elusimicrobiota bacterium]
MEPKLAIKAVFFDIGNVLLRFDPAEVKRRIIAAVSRRPLAVFRLMGSMRLAEAVECGRVKPLELYRLFREKLGFQGDFKAFRRLWCDHFTLDRGAQALLKRVSRRRPVYLLSNTNRLHYEFIRRNYAFARYIRGAILSYRLGLRKPGAAIYEAALRRARVRPGEALFIDDMAENVEGARRAGMRALRYGGAKKLEGELRRLGLVRSGLREISSAHCRARQRG